MNLTPTLTFPLTQELGDVVTYRLEALCEGVSVRTTESAIGRTLVRPRMPGGAR